jgi:glycosyltransferase involved in cell wall biosynthesis
LPPELKIISRKPNICLLASQYFNWGIYGGFGSMTRKLAESLTHSGYLVEVIVPRRKGQQPVEKIGGVTVRSFAPLNLAEAYRLLRATPADIFHSQDPTFLTYLAQKLHSDRIHLITCRDPRAWYDWAIEFQYATPRRRLLIPFNWLTESSPLVNNSVRQADGVFCPAHFLCAKVKQMYRLAEPPKLLPNLIDVPERLPEKREPLTVTFIGRWDRRKRPELFLELAKAFPEYRFIAVGQGSASAEVDYDAGLRRQYRGIKNLEMPGLLNRFEKPEQMHRLLSETWVLVSTAAREGLPLTFLEAGAYGCAILSAVDPDQFATHFGKQVKDGDFVTALHQLLQESPLEKGKLAHSYIKETYESSKALVAHLEQYHDYARRL